MLALKGGAVCYVLPDHLGTPRAIKDQAGSVVWRWTSDAFGDGMANESATGGAPFVFNQRFPGQQFDSETGLYYNNARYYDPLVGRYISSDPAGLEGGRATYGYAASSPLVYTDPSGRIIPLAVAIGMRVGIPLLANAYRINQIGIAVAEIGAGVSLASSVRPGVIVPLAYEVVKDTCAAARPQSSSQYSVLYEMTLDASLFLKGEGAHFQAANSSLHAAMTADSAFANSLEKMAPGITSGVEPGMRVLTPATHR